MKLTTFMSLPFLLGAILATSGVSAQQSQVEQCIQCWNSACSNDTTSQQICCGQEAVGNNKSQCCMLAYNTLTEMFSINVDGTQCTQSEIFNPLTEQTGTQIQNLPLNPGDYIVNQFEFPCNGCVDSINMRVEKVTVESDEEPFHFFIFRTFNELYELKNKLPAFVSTNLADIVVTATPNSSEQICFEEGEVLGFSIPENAEVNLFHTTLSQFGAGISELSGPLEYEECDELDGFYRSSEAVPYGSVNPLISVVVTTLTEQPATTATGYIANTDTTAETTEDTTSTTEGTLLLAGVSAASTTEQTNVTPVPMYVIIAGGAIGGVICLLLLLVVIVVCACIIQRRHNKTVQFGEKRKHRTISAVSPIVGNRPKRSVSEIRSPHMESIINSRTSDNVITIENTDATDNITHNNHSAPQMHHYHVLEDELGSPPEDSYKYMTMYPPDHSYNVQTGQLDAILQEEDTLAYQDPTELASMQAPQLKYRSTVKNPLYSTSGQVSEDMEEYVNKMQAVYDEPHELMKGDTTNPQNVGGPFATHTYHELENTNKPSLENPHQGGGTIYTETGELGVSETPDDSPFGSQYSIPSNDHDLVTPTVSVEHPPSPYETDLAGTGKRDHSTGHHYYLLEQEGEGSLEGSLGRHRVFERGLYVPDSEQRRQMSMGRQHLNVSVYDDFVKTNRQKSYKKRRFFEESETFWPPAEAEQKIYDQFYQRRFREIFRDQIQIEKHLGVGQFGSVSKGVWNNQDSTKRVAVKTLKPTIRQDAKIKFLQEAAIMGQFFHSNVVRLYGVVTVGEPVMIVMELMGLGDLNTYLWKNYVARGQDSLPPPQPETLLSFCRQIACGMKYLARKHFVHRDLAARNILINETLVCKVGDFGMSRHLKEETYYVSKGGTVPIKWTAPEGLNYKKFSSASDVYSYGMVLFEIWSLGGKPLSDIKIPDVANLVTEGYCQPPPPGCPRKIYEVMVHSWNPKYNDRPTFDEIFETLNGSDEELLGWSEHDLAGVSKKATQVGANADEGKNLYKDLQNIYRATVV